MSKKMVLWRGLFAAALFMLLEACGSDTSNVSAPAVRDSANEFVPADAVDRRDEPDAPWVQISFNVRRKPFEFAIDIERAIASGWRICRPRTSDWTGYEDASQGSVRYTQHRKYLFYKDGVQVVAVGMYHSESEQSAVKPNGEGRNRPVQQVSLVAQRSTDQEARAEAAEQSLVCE
jgi:hypothetical protein